MEKKERRIVQIATSTHDGEALCFALCDDGTVFVEDLHIQYKDGSKFTEQTWKKLPPIPQD